VQFLSQGACTLLTLRGVAGAVAACMAAHRCGDDGVAWLGGRDDELHGGLLGGRWNDVRDGENKTARVLVQPGPLWAVSAACNGVRRQLTGAPGGAPSTKTPCSRCMAGTDTTALADERRTRG